MKTIPTNKFIVLSIVYFNYLLPCVFGQTSIQLKDKFYWDSINIPSREPYTLGPDSKKQAGVPEGTVTKYHWISKKNYPGTERDYWLYVPKQYNADKPACLMIFQDGEMFLNGKEIIPTVVFDNLINRGEIPVMIGLFVNPGDKGPGNPIYGGKDNRSFEYDTISDQYPRFLVDELIPEVKKKYNITDDPAGRAICGISSGGICAFNAAWQRPNMFGKVISYCGSFANIRGGYVFPFLVRSTPKKNIRVFLQSGAKDANVYWGNWPLINKEMASALAYSNYDYQFVFGEGGHNLVHAGSIFPETLRWLWRDYIK